MLRQIYTSTKVIPYDLSGIGEWIYNPIHFVKSWDALFIQGMGDYDAVNAKVYLDGSCFRLSYFMNFDIFGANHTIPREGGRVAWNYHPNYYKSEELACLPMWGNSNIIGNWSGDPILFIDDTNRIVLVVHSYSAGIDPHFGLIAYNLDTAEELFHIHCGDESDGINESYVWVQWVKHGIVMFCIRNSGKIWLMDYLRGEVIGYYTVPPAELISYNCNDHVVVTIQSDKKIRLFAMESIPESLSPPEFVSGETHATQMQGEIVQTQLTDGLGLPCEGWVVNWELSAPANGSLDKSQSVTDENGIAKNFYFGPLSSGGSDTIVCFVKEAFTTTTSSSSTTSSTTVSGSTTTSATGETTTSTTGETTTSTTSPPGQGIPDIGAYEYQG